jgi:hypothetical protein
LFLRFSTYPLRNGSYTVQASLRHSVWIKPKGQPRSCYLAYLGSIRSNSLYQESAQRKFWERALAKFNTIEMKKRQRTQLERALAARVPRPAHVVPLDDTEKRHRYWAKQWAKAAKRAQRKRRA